MFEQYACIPLDVPPPPVEIEEFRRFVQTNCERCAFTDNIIRYVLFYARKPIIDGEPLLHPSDPRLERPGAGATFVWDPTFASAFPGLLAWFESLPFTKLYGVDLVTQTDHIRDHMDIYGYNNSASYYRRFRQIEPRYYRILFCYPHDDVARNHSFYLTKAYNGQRHYVTLPDATQAFAMSSSTCYHGALFNPGHYKTTAAVFGELDVKGHLALLRRSLDKYGDHAIQLVPPGPVAGPGAELPYRAA
jgi:hypothetical protein